MCGVVVDERALRGSLQGLRLALGRDDDNLLGQRVGPQDDRSVGEVDLVGPRVAGVAEVLDGVEEEDREAAVDHPVGVEGLAVEQGEGDHGIDEPAARDRERDRAALRLHQRRAAGGQFDVFALEIRTRPRSRMYFIRGMGDVPVEDDRPLDLAGARRTVGPGGRAPK